MGKLVAIRIDDRPDGRVISGYEMLEDRRRMVWSFEAKDMLTEAVLAEVAAIEHARGTGGEHPALRPRIREH